MKFSLDDLVTFDCEVYPNYFLAAFKRLGDGRVVTIEAKGYKGSLSESDKLRLRSIMTKRVTFGFNSRNYDIPVILYALASRTCEDTYKLSDFIITNNSYGWQTLQKFNLSRPSHWNHFDVQEPAPGVRVSLKLYGGRMHSRRLQDLPIEPGTELTDKDMEDTKNYCINDLDTNIDLYNRIAPQMQLRVDMSTQYDQDLMSKSDAQIAEAVIKAELRRRSPKTKYSPPRLMSGSVFRYVVPDYIQFETEDLQHTLELIRNHEFKLNAKGSIELPKDMKNLKIKLGKSVYQLGIGGLHSKEKKQTVVPTENQILADRDVASYYPSIILTLGLAPRHLGPTFLDVYRQIVDTRLVAKKTGNKVLNESLKIVVNGSFGKLGNKYSILYSPDLMMQVTLTGQLALLMLIERLELAYISVISANTDGFVSLVDTEDYDLYDAICFDWEIDTGFELEETRYDALYSRDVNNYLAVTANGTKGKGIFSQTPLSKNPQAPICVEAVTKFLTEKTPIATTITNCKDLTKFLTVRTVNGGAVWKDQYLGRVVRWVLSPSGEKITYKKNGNKVAGSDGALPVMELGPDKFDWTELDYKKYIENANDILGGLGCFIE